jgi:hypothetical protein
MIGNGLNESFCHTPAPVTVLPVNSIVTQLALSDYFTCTLLSTTQTMCFGYDNYGQMGQGTFGTQHPLPVLVGNPGVIEVACGGDGSSGTICLVYFDKSINCSGSGTSGQLGNGQFQDTNVFVQVLGLPTFSPTTLVPTTLVPTGLPTTLVPTALPTSMNTECVPSIGINKKQCLQKVSACGISNSMKWMYNCKS